MSFGKMNARISIVLSSPVKDAEGFATKDDCVLASVRAYKEERHGSERWANMAAFSTANAIFRFRKIPDVAVDATMFITDVYGRYRIISVQDVRGRGMYIEAICEKLEGTVY